jgi:hypothetical protein
VPESCKAFAAKVSLPEGAGSAAACSSESAANVGGGDFADLIAIDESQAVRRGDDDAVEQILLRDLKNMLDCAELFPGLR